MNKRNVQSQSLVGYAMSSSEEGTLHGPKVTLIRIPDISTLSIDFPSFQLLIPNLGVMSRSLLFPGSKMENHYCRDMTLQTLGFKLFLSHERSHV